MFGRATIRLGIGPHSSLDCIGCQTVVLRIEGSIVNPPHVRPHFLVEFFLFLVLGSWYLTVIGVDVTFYLTD